MKYVFKDPYFGHQCQSPQSVHRVELDGDRLMFSVDETENGVFYDAPETKKEALNALDERQQELEDEAKSLALFLEHAAKATTYLRVKNDHSPALGDHFVVIDEAGEVQARTQIRPW